MRIELELEAKGPNRTRIMDEQINRKVNRCFTKWYAWADLELKQRFGFQHEPEQ